MGTIEEIVLKGTIKREIRKKPILPKNKSLRQRILRRNEIISFIKKVLSCCR